MKASGGAQCEPQPETGSLKVCKFNDLDGDTTRDDGEAMLAGWSFNVTPAIIGLSVLPAPIQMTTDENGCDIEEDLARRKLALGVPRHGLVERPPDVLDLVRLEGPQDQVHGYWSRKAGKRITSRMVSRPESSIARRSIPRPRPPVGGIP